MFKTSSRSSCGRTVMEGDGKGKEGESAAGEDDCSLARLCGRGSTTQTARAQMWQTARPARSPHSDHVLLLQMVCREPIPAAKNIKDYTGMRGYSVPNTSHRISRCDGSTKVVYQWYNEANKSDNDNGYTPFDDYIAQAAEALEDLIYGTHLYGWCGHSCGIRSTSWILWAPAVTGTLAGSLLNTRPTMSRRPPSPPRSD